MGIIVGWIVLAFVVAELGKGKEIGYWPTFWFSILLSPLIGAILAIASAKEKQKCSFCKFESKGGFDFCPACGKDTKGLTSEDYKTGKAPVEPESVTLTEREVREAIIADIPVKDEKSGWIILFMLVTLAVVGLLMWKFWL